MFNLDIKKCTKNKQLKKYRYIVYRAIFTYTKENSISLAAFRLPAMRILD